MNANENMFNGLLPQSLPLYQSLPLPAQEVSIDVLLEKYAKGSEDTIAAVQERVARSLAEYESADLRESMSALSVGAAAGFHPGRAHQFGRRHGHEGDVDELLRAAGWRFNHRLARRHARHLHGACRGG